MKRIDFENHFYAAGFMDALAERTEYPTYDKKSDIVSWVNGVDMAQGILLPKLLDMGTERLALMDRLGIDAAVISCSPGTEQLDSEVSVEVSRKTNDTLYELTKKYPTRYKGSAILPVKDVPASVKEFERCVKELGFVAWHTHSNYGTTTCEDAMYRPIFKKAAELGAYVYLHPQLSDNPRLIGYGFALSGPGLGFTVDTLITTTRLIMSGLFDELPNLTVMLGHLGEGLPFLLDRIDNRVNLFKNNMMKNKHLPSYYFKHNILVTTSGNMSPSAFQCTKEVLGIDHILFGSDYPFEDPSEMVSFVNNLPLTTQEREALYYKNAEKLGVKF